MTPYEELVSLIKDVGVLAGIRETLSWDQETMMPKGMALRRALESSVMAKITHEKHVDPRIGELLEQIEESTLNEEEQAQVREIRFHYERTIKVPSRIEEELAQKTSEASEVWAQAKKNNNFASFAPILKEIINLQKELAHAIDPTRPVYEVLYEDYEPGLSIAQTQELFDQVKSFVVPFLKRIVQKPLPQAVEVDVSKEVQKSFCHEIAEYIGYDFNRGRLDESNHPFTATTRITTSFTHDWIFAIEATIHEAGHGMYEQGLPEKHYGTPLGTYASIAVHESQSRFWENHVGRSEAFWKSVLPKLNEAYDQNLDVGVFYAFLNTVKPSFIRVQADELTYPLHIIVRFELEQAIFKGELEVDDLPKAWNEKMQELLGITPEKDSLGVLQDVHWCWGSFAYFPTYSIGTMMAAQLNASMRKDIQDMDAKIEKGDFVEIHTWLKEKIHAHGQRYRIHDLVKIATGKQLSANDYLAYLKEKFSKIYDLE